jgi:Ca2+/Na+ antiporter
MARFFVAWKRSTRKVVGKRSRRLPYVLAALLACAVVCVIRESRKPVLDSAIADGLLIDGRRLEESCGSATPTEEGALSGYPKTPFSIDQHKRGAIILPIFVIFLMFYGLAISCDKYFQPALEAICEHLNMGDDVAGATFMAAGGSAPELATSMLGVFVSKSDVGIGTIVGSAVFNVLFVIAACALLAPNLHVTWYPLARDCIYYCMSILALTVVVLDQKVQWYEACFLFLLYIIYCTIMVFNPAIEAWMLEYVANFENRVPNRLQSAIISIQGPFSIFIYLTILVNTVAMLGYDEDEHPAAGIVNHVCNIIFVAEFVIKNYGFGMVGYWKSAPDAFDGVLVALIGVEYIIAGSGGTMAVFRGLKFIRFLRFLRVLRILRVIALLKREMKDASTQTDDTLGYQSEVEMVPDSVVPIPTGHVPIMPVTTEFEPRVQSAASAPAAALQEPARRATAPPSTQPTVPTEGAPFMQTAGLTALVCSEGVLPGAVPTGSDGGEPRRNQPAPVTVGRKEAEITQKTYVGDTGGSNVAEKAAAAAGNEDDNGADEDDGDGEDDDDDGPFDPMDWGESPLDKSLWLITLPLVLMIFITIPDCKNPRFEKLWALTFMMCIVWIAALAYVMVWMATTFGVVTGIPDPVMGLTLLAAGTSIPDALSSLAVARKGHGDMAVSSSVGSNIFDILVGLPVPWMLYGAATAGESIPICSSSLGIMIITLFVMVALVVCSINICNWRLTRKLGYTFLALYFLFVAESLALEYDLILSE